MEKKENKGCNDIIHMQGWIIHYSDVAFVTVDLANTNL